MANVIHSESIIGKFLRWTRRRASEPRQGATFTNREILEYASKNLAEFLPRLYGACENPPYASFTITPVVNQELYMLPGDVMEVTRLAALDTNTGQDRWVIEPGDPRWPEGPSAQLDGLNFLRLRPYPQSNESFSVRYIPGGYLLPHQNVCPVFDTDDDAGTQLIAQDGSSFYVESRASTAAGADNYLLGDFDKRPNAFVGQRLRILGTVGGTAPDSFNFFPVQERIIETYTASTGKLTFKPALDFDPADCLDTSKSVLYDPPDSTGRTYYVYEILPNIDPALWWLISEMVALDVANAMSRHKTVSMIRGQLQSSIPNLVSRWATAFTAKGSWMDTQAWDDIDSYLEP